MQLPRAFIQNLHCDETTLTDLRAFLISERLWLDADGLVDDGAASSTFQWVSVKHVKDNPHVLNLYYKMNSWIYLLVVSPALQHEHQHEHEHQHQHQHQHQHFKVHRVSLGSLEPLPQPPTLFQHCVPLSTVVNPSAEMWDLLHHNPRSMEDGFCLRLEQFDVSEMQALALFWFRDGLDYCTGFYDPHVQRVYYGEIKHQDFPLVECIRGEFPVVFDVDTVKGEILYDASNASRESYKSTQPCTYFSSNTFHSLRCFIDFALSRNYPQYIEDYGNLSNELYACMVEKNSVKAEELQRLLLQYPDGFGEPWDDWYNLSCFLALQGKVEEAIDALHTAVQKGYWDVEHMDEDTDMNNIRSHPAYVSLRARVEQAAREMSFE